MAPDQPGATGRGGVFAPAARSPVKPVAVKARSLGR